MYHFFLMGVLLSLLLKRNPISIIINVTFKAAWLLIGSFLLQIGLEIIAVNFSDKQYTFFLFLSFIGILLGLFINRHISGIKWILTGTFMNILALITHGGLMPVSEKAMIIVGLQHLIDYSRDSRHQEMGDSFFWWLGDWIPFFTLFGTNFVLSPGDVIVGIGLILFCIYNSSKRS